ncbi:MAG: hypothetical protein ACRBBM_19110 [Pseudomonadaceae bacterium]
MGNYVYLVGSKQKEPLKAKDDSLFVLSARSELPLFWQLLYKSVDYSMVIDHEEMEYENRYPFLSTSKELALSNAANRQDFILSILPAKWSPLWFEFIEFLRNSDSQYIHFHQQEYACLYEPFENWGEKIQEILSGFDSNPIFFKGRFIFRRRNLTIPWYLALEASNISFPSFRDIRPWKLVGGEGDFAPSERYLKMWG